MNTFVKYKRLVKITLTSFFFICSAAHAQITFELKQSGEGIYQLIAVISESKALLGLQNKEVAPKDFLKVYVGKEEMHVKLGRPAMLGAYVFAENQLSFSPVGKFQPGQSYIATLQTGEKHVFSIPKEEAPQPRVSHIYPSADSLPSNLLKFYIEFSEPMREGHAYVDVQLFDAEDKLVRDPFVILQPELWDGRSQRLTLWLDPGRVKRNLRPNTEKGGILQKGKIYTLLVKGSWKSQKGVPLNASIRKEFVVEANDRSKPGIDHWQVIAPKAETRAALMIDFQEPMDEILAQHMLSVWDMTGKLIEGTVRMDEKGKKWFFVPDAHWSLGKYHIFIEARFEDLAGNNLARLFDRDLMEKSESPGSMEIFRLDFKVE